MKYSGLRGVGSFKPSAFITCPTRCRRVRRGPVLLALAFCFFLTSLSPALASDGALDPSFVTDSGSYSGVQFIPVIRGQVGYPFVTGAPYNGYNLVFGSFWGLTVGTTTQNNQCIARLNNTGALDTNFVNNQGLNGEIRGVFIYPDDYPVVDYRNKILIWGRFNAFSGTTFYNNLARLNADGSIDTTFPPLNSYGGAVNSVAVQGWGTGGAFAGTSDKLLVAGYNLKAGSSDEGDTYQLVRLNYNGNPDTGFTHWGAPNGYITGVGIVSDPIFGTNNVRLYCTYPKNPDGSGGFYYLLILDANANIPSVAHPPIAFIGDETVDAPVFNMVLQSDNKWVACGEFRNVYNTATSFWVPRNRVARITYNASGGNWTLDTGYDVGVGPNSTVATIRPMKTNSPKDDRMVAIGNFNTWDNTPCGFIVRLNTDGSRDTSFNFGGTGADDRIRALNWKADGTAGWIYGYFRNYNSGGTDYAQGGIGGLNADGYRTTSFGNVTANAGWQGMVYSLTRQSDGKIIIGGDFNGVGGKYRNGIARINPDGSLDNSFRGGVDGIVHSVAVQPDGKILLGGQFGQCSGFAATSLARLNPDATLDRTFNPLLVGDDNSVNNINHVVPLANGQIMIAGDIYNGTGSPPIARLNSDGSLDNGFWQNVTSIPNPIPDAQWTWGKRVVVSGSKYLIAGGYATATNWWGGGFLGRLNNDGTLDTSFGPTTPGTNVQTMDGPVDDLLLQSDGKIMASGWFTQVLDGSGSPPGRTGIARFFANGLLDASFTPSLILPGGANTMTVAAIAAQPNGRILIEEQFLNKQGDFNYIYVSGQVARLLGDGSLDPTFSLGTMTQGYFYPQAGSSILRLPNGKAIVGGVFGKYNSTQAWSLVRIFASPGNFNPAILMLLLD